ncbi:MAG: thioredoxin family protein [Deltaproteobacteria bacterium]|nr:thioredoxin family protein [Deltaproteobacteria bacterium]MBW2177758.1 thioredoxin family protein [Deltaproteobacteria bacterium]MBW2296727.1 thioredoxin family protein [Deltaproteobacteria bacterium]
MTIEVLGPGCKNCDDLYDNVLNAIEKLGQQDTIKVEKQKEIDYFIKMGVFSTPALVIDGKVVSTSRVLSPDQIVALIKDGMA